ncbi:bile acid:sodium symporter family protein [Yoonia sp. SS1-5]|uniref:Bile acid:sodium symporter family protein n=1 Tax=Yoonia rhodophyticola TaxID=3137370 RepID=A0AAN0MGG3_9RHOB
MDILVSVVLPLGLAFIMFSLGVGLTPADFLRVGQRPLAFTVGALNQIILLPAVAYMVAISFGLTGELAVGFMILAACPGGVTSNIIARLAKADVALSVSLTAVISLTSVITVPLILGFAITTFMAENAPDVNITRTAITMFALTVVPITVGMAVRRMFPAAIAGVERGLSFAAVILFVVIVLAAVGANWALFTANMLTLGPASLALLAVLTTLGFLLPRILGRSLREAKTISIETGIQNGTLGIAIAALIVDGGAGFTGYALPSAIYGVVMYLIVVPAVLLYRRMD